MPQLQTFHAQQNFCEQATACGKDPPDSGDELHQAAQRKLAHDSAPPRGIPAWRYKQPSPLGDGRVPRWVVGGRRYQIVPKRTLGIFTEQLKMTPEDWT
jgi:hypothetical protein